MRALTVATVNAAIIAIFFALASGYALLHFQALHRLRREAIEEANKVNSLAWTFDFHNDMEITDSLLFRYDPMNKDHRIEMDRRLWRAVMSWPERGSQAFGEERSRGFGTTDFETEDRATRALEAMSVLGSQYPFPQCLEPTAAPTIAHCGPYAVPLDTLQQTRRWREDMAGLAGAILSWHGSLMGHLRELMDRYDRVQAQGRSARGLIPEIGFSPGEMEDALRAQAETDHRMIPDEFMEHIRRGREIAEAVQGKFDELTRYRLSLPSKRTLLSALAIAALGFVCGVTLPILRPSISPIVYEWVPQVIYALGFVALFLWFLSAYQREEVTDWFAEWSGGVRPAHRRWWHRGR
jgi:hypothetical protein